MKIQKPDKPKKKPKKYLRKRRKRSPKAKLFDRVWKKCSEYVRWRDKGRCFTCPDVRRWQEQQAGHFIHGKTKPTFFNEKQIRCQCVKCNHFLNGNLGIFGVRLVALLGQKEVDDIIQQSFQFKLWKTAELKGLDEYFTNKLKELN